MSNSQTTERSLYDEALKASQAVRERDVPQVLFRTSRMRSILTAWPLLPSAPRWRRILQDYESICGNLRQLSAFTAATMGTWVSISRKHRLTAASEVGRIVLSSEGERWTVSEHEWLRRYDAMRDTGWRRQT